jgi:MFS family permease
MTSEVQASVHHRPGFWLMVMALPLLMAASVAPSPLYVVYQHRWGFTASTLTMVYAVYMGPLVVALLTVGGLSDQIGRRPVVVASLLVQALSMVVFMTATGVPALFVGRLLQGLAAGTGLGAVTSGILDLAGGDGRRLGALLNSVGPAIGIGLGAAISGLMVQFLPAPRVAVYVLLAVLFVVLAVAVAVRIEPAARSRGDTLSVRPRLGVPPAARRSFALLVPGVVASAAMGGFYNSLSGSVAVQILGHANRAISGFAILTLQAAAIAASLAMPALARAPRVVVAGSCVLAAGLGVLALSLVAGSTTAFFLGTALAGAGYGAVYLGTVRVLADLAPAGRRAELMSALNVVNYLSLSVPTLAAGVLATHVGLRPTAISFCLVLVALALTSVVALTGAKRV